MQATKDSFYMTLRSRLAELNPQRTAVIGGASRPAIMVVENERPGEDSEMNDTFCLSWGAPEIAEPGGSLQTMTCTVSYRTQGSESAAGTDRGRVLAAMDTELSQLCVPLFASKMDYTKTPAAALETKLFWSPVTFGDAELQSNVIRRTATVTIYFTPEGA